MLEIKALGNLIITEDGNSLDSLGSLRAQVLLTFLALENVSHHRNYLANMLWPESSEEKALASLRVVLTELRKEVGKYLNISRTDIGIHPESQIKLDVHDLERSLKLGSTEQALDLYRGDLLTGVFIQGSPEFENWRRWESERIRKLMTQHLEEGIRNRISLSCYEEALELSQGLMKIDPFNETANKGIALSLAFLGQRTAAIKHILTYRNNLRDDLGIEVSPDFDDIQEKISQGDLDSLELTYIPRNNLPLHLSKFIGRDDVLARLTKEISNPNKRLISIIGPGGIGKTRLAIQSIKRNLHLFPGGAFFVPLEATSPGEGIFQAIAEAMDFKFDSVVSLITPQSQLLDVIGKSKTVLLLDSFEHMTQSGSQISFLLNNTTNLEIFVTSRFKLNLPGEWSLVLEGMNTSEPQGTSEALELFLHKTAQISPDMIIGEADLTSASRICELIDGLPLGIELAAGWTSLLSLSEIVHEITNSYDFLDSQTDPTEKLKNLKAVFRSSWNLLGQSQQEILPRLSVFKGGFSRHAAKQVSGATLTDLAILVDKSMLQVNQNGKFEIHPVVSEYCQEILFASSEEYQEIHFAHYQYYAEYLSSRVPEMYLLSETSTYHELKSEISNIQTAAEYAVKHLDQNQDQDIIKDFYSYYIIHGWYEGSLAFQRLAEIIEQNLIENQNKYDLMCAKILAQQGFFYSNLGLLEESEEICRKALPVLQEADEHRELAICIQNLGINAIFRGEYDLALNYLDQAIIISQLSSCSSFASFYLWVGYVHFLLGNYKKGMDNFYISLDLFEQDNNDRGTAFSLSKMGLAQDALGNYQEAIQYHQKSLNIFQESDNQAGQGYALSRMSLGALLLKDYPSALKLGEEALTEFSKVGHRWGRCASISRIAYAMLGLGDTPNARRLFLEALAIAHEHQLDPLCLHALAGIACLKAAMGDKKNGQAIMDYVQRHPKTPEIYITVNGEWFNLGKKKKIAAKKLISDPALVEIAMKILEEESLEIPAHSNS